MTFLLDDRLAADTSEVCLQELSYVGLMNDARYPWLVLVPRQNGLVEVNDLDTGGRALLWREVEQSCSVLKDLYPQAKINIGALGNIVRQLHVHVIARHEGDAAWPGPVWGVGDAQFYEDVGLAELLTRLREKF